MTIQEIKEAKASAERQIDDIINGLQKYIGDNQGIRCEVHPPSWLLTMQKKHFVSAVYKTEITISL